MQTTMSSIYMLDINHIRKEYRLKSLDINNLNPDPFLQFNAWFDEAQLAEVMEANAMALATASAQGRPSCRIVLLKGSDSKGFLFFTNYNSRKGIDLASNPFACVTFYWRELERQVIIDGSIEKLTREEGELYFASRPRGSQLGAWASHQDESVASREELERAYGHFEKMYERKSIPMPPYWGGYRLLPERFEFWQGRPNRLHDRFRYLLRNGSWQIDRLAP
jgi:pyridoxamine 5'-phosphate oxidase